MVELFPSRLSLCLVGAQGLTEERHYKGSYYLVFWKHLIEPLKKLCHLWVQI